MEVGKLKAQLMAADPMMVSDCEYMMDEGLQKAEDQEIDEDFYHIMVWDCDP